MGQPYIGEIRMFAASFPPNGWELCQGKPIPIAENSALFTLIGTMYGGDGQTYFNLPNLASRIPIHMGTGPDGINYQISEASGTEQETLTVQKIPVHSHPELAANVPGTDQIPTGKLLAKPISSQQNLLLYGSDSVVQMNSQAIGPTGGSQPHDNLQPFLVINFIISMFGVFPTQT
jgi:microcystin-dependent protein